jgi:predicted small lipoprotein YifL
MNRALLAPLLAAACLLNGCGLKGPLYLPDAAPAAKPAPAPQSDAKTEKK